MCTKRSPPATNDNRLRKLSLKSQCVSITIILTRTETLTPSEGIPPPPHYDWLHCRIIRSSSSPLPPPRRPRRPPPLLRLFPVPAPPPLPSPSAWSSLSEEKGRRKRPPIPCRLNMRKSRMRSSLDDAQRLAWRFRKFRLTHRSKLSRVKAGDSCWNGDDLYCKNRISNKGYQKTYLIISSLWDPNLGIIIQSGRGHYGELRMGFQAVHNPGIVPV